MKVYVISGLGADYRAFKKIKFPAGAEIIYINWIAPDRNETVKAYTIRLSAAIDQGEPFILIGLSFGSIVAGEMAKVLHPELVILLSGMRISRQMPVIYKISRVLRLYKLLPYRLLKKGHFLTYAVFGVSKKEDKDLLKRILADTDIGFLKWAVRALLFWENDTPAENIYHIHGSKDRLIPVKNPMPDIIIPGGGHLVVLTHAEKINAVIAGKIGTL